MGDGIILLLLLLLAKGGLKDISKKPPGSPPAMPTMPPFVASEDKGWFAVWDGFHWIGPQHITPLAANELHRQAVVNSKAPQMVKLYKFSVNTGWTTV